ncbi:MAG: NAD-dependent epimerase/dehydratase family protein [Deltaproteobacteria bacterium]|nr:NAD-dependent epimerase/dehydratase family protein [Deltaproteobacteria bacterium]
MSVLVTGGTGFIGAQVVRLLLEQGEKGVVVFDINPSTKLLDDVADQVEVVRGDLGNFSHVLNVVKTFRPKVIYHMGGMLSVPSDADPAASFRANAMGTFHVLEAARLLDVVQVLFASTIATYGIDVREPVVDDYTLQRPQLFYGCTKVFSELLGQFYKRKYDLDFRGVRYPSIVGPGVKTPGIVQYNAWVIEECAKGKPYIMYVKPETRCPVMYFKDSARAIVMLGTAPVEHIKMVNYIIAGPTPAASAQELVDLVRSKVPGARIEFQVDEKRQKIIDGFTKPLDDGVARKEWGWKPEYDPERIVEDFLEEMKMHPQRYT